MNALRLMAEGMRPHQWVKNVLIFVPLLASHQLLDGAVWGKAWIGFFAFSLCASAMYIANDLIDLQADRLHPQKKNRPFAAGALSRSSGVCLGAGLVIGSLLLGMRNGPGFVWVLVAYGGITSAYSWRLKKLPLVDVFCLAALYAMRLFAGQQATGIECSEWLLALALFLFLSLAILKRFHEAFAFRGEQKIGIVGRGYTTGDVEFLSVFGLICGALAVLVMALYVNSENVGLVYSNPRLLLLICPLLLFWISHVWLVAHRGEMDHDPVRFALRDAVSWLVFLLAGIVVLLARFWS